MAGNQQLSKTNSPQSWLAYAQSTAISQIPLKSSDNGNASVTSKRDVYLDLSTAFKPMHERVEVFADVIALAPNTKVTVPKNGVIKIYARVLTASEPVHLHFTGDSSTGFTVDIFASVLDQPITCSFNDIKENFTLNLGAVSGNVGVEFDFESGKINSPDYFKAYFDLTNSYSPQLLKSVKTQLRIASVLFWQEPKIALSLASHIALMTLKTPSEALLNVQAVALGRQLAAQALIAPDMSYAPVLKIETYMKALESAIAAAIAYDQEYREFRSQVDSDKDELATWEQMIGHAQGSADMRKHVRDVALRRYKDATDIVGGTTKQFKDDQSVLEDIRKKFVLGIEKWKTEMRLKAIFDVLSAIAEFAVGIGLICVGNPSELNAPAQVGEAIQAVKQAEKLGSEGTKLIKSSTLETLKNCVELISKVYPTIGDAVENIQTLETSPGVPNAKIKLGSVSKGDEDAAAIVSLAAWDTWILESDQQLEFPVNKEINGASEYRLALRKHAINGKQLVQSQTEAIKAGREFIYAHMEFKLCQRDVQGLKDLKTNLNHEKEQKEDAAGKLYDCLMTLKTSIAILMRNLTWAYKYDTLQESKVLVQSSKATKDYVNDLSLINQEFTIAQGRYSSDYQTFDYQISLKELLPEYSSAIIKSLQSQSHMASFTLAPHTFKNGKSPDLAGPFRDGSHFRLQGMDPFLVGASPDPRTTQEHVETTKIHISTSGVYADIEGDTVFHFVNVPINRNLEYSESSTAVSTITKSKSYAEPTPFTQWTIRLLNADKFDLTKLTDLKMRWKGKARFNNDGSGKDAVHLMPSGPGGSF